MSDPALSRWLLEMRTHASLATSNDDRNYYSSHPETLISTSNPLQITIGTGAQILAPVLDFCLSCTSELILVTCFWAKSKSQRDISALLVSLSQKAISSGRTINVRLCFSSISPLQKLFQTSSLRGKTYGPARWTAMGLPSPDELKGLKLTVKSIFVRPFSVMHPKFILVDRQRAFMPSCNVSWEEWFEGCVEMKGPIVGKLFEFWTDFWGKNGNELPSTVDAPGEDNSIGNTTTRATNLLSQRSLSPDAPPVTTVLLPSPHHLNPRFRPFSRKNNAPPPTPLNTFLLSVLNGAEANSSIYIQTPNLTSRPFINALDNALSRGVHIHILTSRRLMILEQLVTAGTITEYEIWKLRRRHRKVLSTYHRTHHHSPTAPTTTIDLETAPIQPGTLKIGYFKPRANVGRQGQVDTSNKSKDTSEPVKSHLKCMIIDDRITVLGSGNMDRASWFTSQELGVAFFSTEVAQEVRRCIDEGLQGRVEYIC